MSLDAEFGRARDVVATWSTVRLSSVQEGLLTNAPLFDIEASSACNLACSFCPRSQLARPRASLELGVFESVLRFLPRDAIVMFSGLGEPLLNPYVEEFVRVLKARGISSCVITNGLLLTPERQQALLDAGIDQFQVSVHAVTPEAWRTIAGRQRGQDLLLANLEHLAAHRPAGLRVQLNLVVSDGCPQEATKVRELAEGLGFALFTRRLHSRGGQIRSGRSREPVRGCGIFAAVTFISAQGDVFGCANDMRGESCLGSVEALTWRQVLDWKRARIRRGAEFSTCARCDDDYRWAILAQRGVDAPPGKRDSQQAPPGLQHVRADQEATCES